LWLQGLGLLLPENQGCLPRKSAMNLINHTIALSTRFSLPECHHQVTDLSIFMADKAIFLHRSEKTKNSNTEKRFPFFMFTLVILKALNLSLMFFV
ncbi:hypothetical protein, partial [Aeromonas veronii]|uniref:hypothetical protein n=1 Tax=Aeromonas veronii TaxID=654 RepID=UPI003D1EB22E